MKIGLKLILAFLVVIFSILVVGYISINYLQKIAQPLTNDIPKRIDEIAKTSELDRYAQFIRYYDEVLTQSARNYAFTQDRKWEERYKTVEPELDRIIKSAIEKGNEKDKEIFARIDKANLALVELEYKTLELVDNGHVDEAIEMMESKEYWNQKRIYEQGIRDYKSARDVAYDNAIITSTQTLDSVIQKTQETIRDSGQLITISILTALVVGTGLSFIISKQISNPVMELDKASKKIANGNFDTRIEIRGNDELHDLAESFNTMAKSLGKSTSFLSRAERKYRSLYEDSPYLYRTIDINGIILDCNKCYADKLGYSKQELVGMSIYDTTAPESLDQMRESFETWKKTGRVDDREVWFRRKDGTIFPVLVSACKLYDENDKLIGSNTVIRDMSEIYKAKKQIEENEALIKEQYEQLKKLDSIKDGFLAMITHELRAPFSPIINYVELLLSQKLGVLNENQQEKLRIVKSSASSLVVMLSDLLDAQKLELGQLTLLKNEHNLTEIINQTVVKLKPTAEYRGIAITTELEENVVFLCDRVRIEQVLINIISNAIDFCPKENGKMWIKLNTENDCAKIVVKDNGIGIQKDKLDKLFVKFYHIDAPSVRERRGTGLGLSICKGIIENHGGSIWAESDGSGKGSEIHIILPLLSKTRKDDKT